MLESAPAFQTLIRNARILDGTGAPAWTGDVGILDGRIAALGDLAGAGAGTVVEARGLAAAPGFIDVHTHDDRAVFQEADIRPKLAQGVTTVVTGNCGISLAPLLPREDPPAPLDLLGGAGDYRFGTFAAFLDALRAAPLPVNVVPLVGHGTLRVGAVAAIGGPAAPGELRTMVRRVEEAMDAGARGFSTGLAYPPNLGATAAETAALARASAARGGRLCVHVRDEFDGVAEATREAFAIARAAEAPLVLSHQKAAGRANGGRSRELLDLYAEEGADVPFALDAYPYEAGSTVLDPAFAAQSREVLVAWSRPHPEAAGRTLAAVAADWGVGPLEALDRLQPGGGVYFHMLAEDVDRILLHPRCMVGSDGLPHDTHPHPRLWGTFPRYLRRMALDRPRLTLEEAVRRITALPAEVFGLRDRGRLAPGFAADLVLFDPDALRDNATYADPRTPPAGIAAVYVNGRETGQGAAGALL